jgi:hypothetical protein
LLTLLHQGLPVRMDRTIWQPGIHVNGCPLRIPPSEIVQQGNAAIRNYFAELKTEGIDHLYEAKMLILGAGGAGKTSLLRRLYHPQLALPAESETTKGIDIHRHDFTVNKTQPFRLNVWDFGGQEIYHATHQFFLTKRSLYVLLDDTRTDDKSVSDPGFKYWLDVIDLFGGHSPVLIFQNEKGNRSKVIDLQGIQNQFNNVIACYAGNLERPAAAGALRAAIEHHAAKLPHIGEQLPASWVKVRAEIETSARQTPHISLQQYFDIYSKHLPFDRTKALHLSRYLHDLGVFLHFQGDDNRVLERIVILQNPWATGAVYRILDDEAVKARCGRFTSADCQRLWADAGYIDMHPELLALMQRFELCYALPHADPPSWLAPQLLPAAKPALLQNWDQSDDLVLRYRYTFLPKGTLPRLMVRLHRFIGDPEQVACVTAVLFAREDTQLLAELLPSGSEIALRARGPERKGLLSVVAAELDAINDSLPGLRDKVEKLIPCTCSVCRSAPLPRFFIEKEMRRRIELQRFTVECPQSFADVDVRALLDGIHAAQLPSWSNEQKPPSRTLQIFMASSNELSSERDAFELYLRQQTDHYLKDGIYLKIVRHENFSNAMSPNRMQDEYNRAVQECDVFVSLFFTKAGPFTEEEFDAAHRQFKVSGLPHIFTFFKDAEIKTGSAIPADLQSLWAFKDKLTSLGHYPTMYRNVEHLKLQFGEQLRRVLHPAEK